MISKYNKLLLVFVILLAAFLRFNQLNTLPALNADEAAIDFSKPEWYYKNEWTGEEQNNFKAWMINYLMLYKEARQELLASVTKDKIRIEKAVDEFIFNYGWRIKES